MEEFTASNGLRVVTDAVGGVMVSWDEPRNEGWSCHSAPETQALREFFAAERDNTLASPLSDGTASADPAKPHRYAGNASGLTCWVGRGHPSGMCGARGEERIHDPYGESPGFAAGGWNYFFAAPDEARCPEMESGGVQCIHFAEPEHTHEVDQRQLGGLPKVIARRRAAGPIEAVTT